jgi:hypothetical protein
MRLENLLAIQRLVRHEAGQAEALLHRARVTLGDLKCP